MIDSQDSAAPSTDRTSLMSVEARRQARRRAWQRRFILALPRFSFVLVVAALTLGAGLQFSSGHGAQESATVYSVNQVRAGLQQDPRAWTGHPIQVRGVLQGPFVFCAEANPCPSPTLGLLDDGNAILGSGNYLPVVPGSMKSVDLPFNVPATFDVQVRAAPDACARNPAILCYQAVVRDTGSASSGERR